MTLTRGERNNNPMNIRLSNIPWKGKITPSTDAAFEQFDNAVDGIRAGAKNVVYYSIHEGLSTIKEVVSRWAPSNENDTQSYISDVCRSMHVGADDDLELLDVDVLEQIVRAIILHENGRCAYDAGAIASACEDALAAIKTS